MSYNISSDNFSNPLLKELLKKLIDYFTSIGSEFYIIGATARDIILSGIHNKEPGRKTDDLDIAIAVPTWNKYGEISVGLCKIPGIKNQPTKSSALYSRKHIYLILSLSVKLPKLIIVFTGPRKKLMQCQLLVLQQ